MGYEGRGVECAAESAANVTKLQVQAASVWLAAWGFGQAAKGNLHGGLRLAVSVLEYSVFMTPREMLISQVGGDKVAQMLVNYSQ